jgi:hypothetical protein
LAPSDSSQDNREDRDECGRDSRKIVAPFVNGSAEVGDQKLDTSAGAIIVIRKLLELALSGRIVATTPGRSDGENQHVSKDRQRGSD